MSHLSMPVGVGIDSNGPRMVRKRKGLKTTRGSRLAAQPLERLVNDLRHCTDALQVSLSSRPLTA